MALGEAVANQLSVRHFIEGAEHVFEAPYLSQIQDAVGNGPFNSSTLQTVGQRIPTVPLDLVDGGVRGTQLFLLYAGAHEQRPNDSPVRHPDPHALRAKPQPPHDVDGRRNHLGVGQGTGLADEIEVELKVLPKSAPLLAFVPKQLRDGVPANRLLEIRRFGRNHAGQRRRHVRPQRDGPPPLILEVIELANNLFSALCRIEFQRLERWTTVFFESVAGRNGSPDIKNLLEQSGVGRVEVPKAGQRL